MRLQVFRVEGLGVRGFRIQKKRKGIVFSAVARRFLLTCEFALLPGCWRPVVPLAAACSSVSRVASGCCRAHSACLTSFRHLAEAA